MKVLPTTPAHSLKEVPEKMRWLIEELWTDEAVGIIGGEPKCCKSFLALSLAIAVASGVNCLSKYRVAQTGKVVLFAAEDALHIVKRRLEGISSSLGISLKDLDIEVITSPSLRLDQKEDQGRLKLTVEKLRPKLLILDPFVRLHRIDENMSGEVAPILANLRELQRLFHLSIIVVHHAKKGASRQRAGQALRGSSEFHAWGDANLFMRRDRNDKLNLSIEHRSAQSKLGIPLELIVNNDDVYLRVCDENREEISKRSLSTIDKIQNIYKETSGPFPMVKIRSELGIRSSTVSQALKELVNIGQLVKVRGGYQLVADSHSLTP